MSSEAEVRVGVSRTPIREAIQRLGAEGAVELVRNKGAVVPTYSPDDLNEIFELRALLAAYGAERAAAVITEVELEVLRGLAMQMLEMLVAIRTSDKLDRMARLDRTADYNNEFHERVLKASGKSRLVSVSSFVTQLPLVHRSFHLQTDAELERSLAQHLELIEALERRDQQWAAAITKSHIISSRNIFMDRAIQRPDSALWPNGSADRGASRE